MTTVHKFPKSVFVCIEDGMADVFTKEKDIDVWIFNKDGEENIDWAEYSDPEGYCFQALQAIWGSPLEIEEGKRMLRDAMQAESFEEDDIGPMTCLNYLVWKYF